MHDQFVRLKHSLSEAGISAIARPGCLTSRWTVGTLAARGCRASRGIHSARASTHRLNAGDSCGPHAGRNRKSCTPRRLRIARPGPRSDHPYSVILLLQGFELFLLVVPPPASGRSLRIGSILGCFRSQEGLSGGTVDSERSRPQGVSPVLSPLCWAGVSTPQHSMLPWAL